MLKKFDETGDEKGLFQVGTPVYIVTRQGKILEGFTVKSRLVHLFTLDRSPIDGSEKQGFTLQGEILKPNWCEGRKHLMAVCACYKQAQELVKTLQKKRAKLL